MKRKRAGTFLLFVIDIFSIFITLQGAIILRRELLPFFFKFPDFPINNFTFFWWVFPIWLTFFAYEGLYTKRYPFWDEIKILWKAVFFATIAVFSILFLGKVGEAVSRTVIVVMGLISLPLLPLIRLNAKKILINSGLLKSRALIIGAGETGKLILKALLRDKNLGYEVVGFMDDEPQKIGSRVDGLEVFGSVNEVEKYIDSHDIHDIVIAMPSCHREKLIRIINNLQHKVQHILLIPDLFGVAVLGTELQNFFQEQVIGLEVKNNLARPTNIFIKKSFDIIVSLIAFLILAIPMLILSVIIRLTSSGRAIYSQERIGKHDRAFRCYKFRTMHHDAEARLEKMLASDSQARTEWEENFKLKNDPRVTRIGDFLRRTSLDELPQIFNVLKGDMSLVGPRPVTKTEIDDYYKDKAELCFGVPPGVTGLWQVSGRSGTSYDYRIALDSWYVRNWNLWLDIVILFKTLRVVFRREGAW
ncbi:MAG: undecaprenyl-phosphate galactose phosphotransferase WbaP [Thermodesulfovibrionia bacterium]|nr:undecaprenyl-phosphate galactose phosphotransferase WbaP [Thermodesulfovibrionia bacterium]